ncbi:MAG: hypothetical protein WAK96_00985 [Desulfobaccales bacterium]
MSFLLLSAEPTAPNGLEAAPLPRRRGEASSRRAILVKDLLAGARGSRDQTGRCPPGAGRALRKTAGLPGPRAPRNFPGGGAGAAACLGVEQGLCQVGTWAAGPGSGFSVMAPLRVKPLKYGEDFEVPVPSWRSSAEASGGPG